MPYRGVVAVSFSGAAKSVFTSAVVLFGAWLATARPRKRGMGRCGEIGWLTGVDYRQM